AVGGDSAGGNLAAVTAQRAAREGVPLAMQLLVYPAVDRVTRRPSLEHFREGFMITADDIAWFHRAYSGSLPADDLRISPIFGDLAGQAPALVVTAAFDPLRDEGEAYAEALRAAGVPTVLRRMPGLVHGFLHMTAVSRTARAATIELAGATRALLG
ncbi:MAG TPA: alpha/beta hydrolase fold domain-containing protein, partial [Minicystis sp.]|nr:alpha/beta hydrolase fold domain-containing protein [Minicystis sp.]